MELREKFNLPTQVLDAKAYSGRSLYPHLVFAHDTE